MRVSVLLATCNRAALLAEAVGAAAALEVPEGWDVELLVIDNASRDSTPAWLAAQPTRLAPGVGLVPLREERPGKSRALNLGIRRATGDVLAFLDDDVLLDRAWLRGLKEGLEAGGEALQGEVRLRLPDRPPRWLTPRVEAILAATTLWSARTPVTSLVGSNMAVVRGAGVPEFCERIGPGVKRFPMGEDTEWSRRALETRRGLFCPAMGATHVVEGRLAAAEVARRQWYAGMSTLLFEPREGRPSLVRQALLRAPREVVRGLYHLAGRRLPEALDALWTLCRYAGVVSAALGRGRGHPLW